MARMQFDIAVVGAGIAGSSIAAHLAEGCSVGLLEMEEAPGFHSTGRSAAIYIDFYGNETIRALTAASKAFFQAPPPGFAEFSLLRDRSILVVARENQLGSLAALVDETRGRVSYEWLSAHDAAVLCPVLDDSKFAAAAMTRGAADIDVNALQAGYLRLLRERGGVLVTNARVTALERREDGWLIKAGDEEILAGKLVNAAGAWAGEIGALAGARDIGMATLRRSAALVDVPKGMSPVDWPGVLDVDEQFYMKPEAGLLMISPADETSVEPGDVQPEELDIAIAVDRIQGITHLDVTRVKHKWAGLRCFVADRSPVVGFDPVAPNFFWMAALGGYGIQTAPALGRLAADLVQGVDTKLALARLGLEENALSPSRQQIGIRPTGKPVLV